ncbi:MAG: hypothetical protein K6F65_04890 [Lachnospiraceae bacterium]|nr:hypothetical protein [Lachnospiraceae bacterium]
MQPASQRYMHTDSMLVSCYAIAATCTPEEAKACVDFNSSALISCANGFRFDKTPVEGQYDEWKK